MLKSRDLHFTKNSAIILLSTWITLLLNLFYMKDINTHLAPVLNLSERSVEESFTLACGFPLTKVLLEDFERPAPVSIPVRIIEGMEEIVERKTVNTRQAFLISQLYELLIVSPVLKA